MEPGYRLQEENIEITMLGIANTIIYTMPPLGDLLLMCWSKE